MAKGQHLTRHQQGIVRRYYEHRDTLMTQKLGELASDLFLADAKRAPGLWESVRLALEKTPADPARVERILVARDVAALASLVNELAGAKPRPT
jgi:hypothetical protein